MSLTPFGYRTLTERLADVLTNGSSAVVGFYERTEGRFRTEPLPAFLQRALGAAQGLREQGLAPHRPALVVGRSPEDMWHGYLATVMAGATPAIHAHRPAFDTRERSQQRLTS